MNRLNLFLINGAKVDISCSLKKFSFALIVFAVCVTPIVILQTTVVHSIDNEVFVSYDLYYDSKSIFFNIVVFCMLIVVLIRARTRSMKLILSVPLLLFALWSLLSAVLSNYKWTAFYGWPYRWQGALAYLAYIVLFIFVLNFLGKDKIKPLITVLFASSVIVSFYALMQYYGFEPLKSIFGDLVDGQIRSTIGNRNFLGSYMVLLTLTSVFLYFNSSKPRSMLLLFLSVIYFSALFVSMTRSAWLGFLAALIFNLWLARYNLKKIYKKVILVLVSFALVGFMLNYTNSNNIMPKIQQSKSEVQAAQEGNVYSLGTSRIYIYKRTIEVLLQKPLFGTGPDCLGYNVRLTPEQREKYMPIESSICIDKAHSEYLEYAATMGFPSLVLYIWFIFSLFIPVVRNRIKLDGLSWGIFAGWTGYLVQATFNIGVISVLPVFFAYCAILQKAVISYKKDELLLDDGQDNEESKLLSSISEN